MKKLIILLESIAREGVYPVFPLLVVKVLGLNILALGLIEGLAETVSLIAYNFLKSSKKRNVVLYLLILSIICRPILGLVENSFILGILRVGERQRVKAYIDEIWNFLGRITGPFLVFLTFPLLDFNYRKLFLLTSIPALVIVVILLMAYLKGISAFPERPRKALLQNTEKVDLSELILNLGTPPALFLILRAQEIGISTYLLPLLWALSQASSYPFNIYAKRAFFSLRFPMGSLIYIGLAFMSDDVYLWFLFALYGIYEGINKKIKGESPCGNSPQETRLAMIFSPLISGVIIGLTWTLYSGAFAFSISAGLTLIAGGIYMFSLKG